MERRNEQCKATAESRQQPDERSSGTPGFAPEVPESFHPVSLASLAVVWWRFSEACEILRIVRPSSRQLYLPGAHPPVLRICPHHLHLADQEGSWSIGMYSSSSSSTYSTGKYHYSILLWNPIPKPESLPMIFVWHFSLLWWRTSCRGRMGESDGDSVWMRCSFLRFDRPCIWSGIESEELIGELARPLGSAFPECSFPVYMETLLKTLTGTTCPSCHGA